jgi:dimethylargininase
MTQYAITRPLSASIGQCELTHQSRQSIDLDLARKQHVDYEACLERLGCHLIRLPGLPDHPDAVFVEDTAIVLNEIAVITRPGAASRRSESRSVADALLPYREIVQIEAPGRLDGGDVLVIRKDIYVGLSSRSNEQAIDQLQQLLNPYGYHVHGVEVRGCLHLKSAMTAASADTILLNPSWIDAHLFEHYEVIEVHPDEPLAANGLLIGETVIYPSVFSKTAEELDKRGIRLAPVDLSELAKAEGAVTCCSLVFTNPK